MILGLLGLVLTIVGVMTLDAGIQDGIEGMRYTGVIFTFLGALTMGIAK